MPFAALVGVAATYRSPDAYDGAHEDLVRRAHATAADDEEVRVFKAELQQALADPAALPDDELSQAVEYDDGSDEGFLRRVWRDLYGDEPVVGS